MHKSKRIIGNLARNYGLDPDEVIISLWYRDEDRFKYLRNPNVPVRENDLPYIHTFILHSDKVKAVLASRRRAAAHRIEYQEHDFSKVGSKTIDPMAYLSKDDVLVIYDALVADFAVSSDPIRPAGVKDAALLESAILHQYTSFEGRLKYSTAESSAAAAMYALSHNHPFVNGNKRTAMVSMLVLLDRHNICLSCDKNELVRISFKLARHELVEPKHLYADAEIYQLAKWIHSHSKAMKRGERPITLRKLRYILHQYACTINADGTISRHIKGGFFTREKILTTRRTLSTIIRDGDEVDKSLIKSIREDLRLTANDGVDQDYFYGGSGIVPADFIDRYRTVLRRLSKF